MKEFFPEIRDGIPHGGPDSKNPLAFKYYEPNRVVGQKSMGDHLRFSVAYWHTFKGTGADPFGAGTLERPWSRGKTPACDARCLSAAAQRAG